MKSNLFRYEPKSAAPDLQNLDMLEGLFMGVRAELTRSFEDVASLVAGSMIDDTAPQQVCEEFLDGGLITRGFLKNTRLADEMLKNFKESILYDILTDGDEGHGKALVGEFLGTFPALYVPPHNG